VRFAKSDHGHHGQILTDPAGRTPTSRSRCPAPDAELPPIPDLPPHPYEVDDEGRAKLPAFLLTAYKAT
jgi:hypothetical protein